MARPYKNGVDYFPLDVQLDEKFELLEAQFGIKAFAVIVKLYQKIYGGEGYYCEWNEDIALLFSQKNNVNYNVVSDILNAAVKRGIFDSKMFESYGILTSAGIQKQYLKIITKRKQIDIKDSYWLIPDTVNSVNDGNNGVNDGKNGVNDGNNAQSKGKEKEKEKEIEKEKESRVEVPPQDERDKVQILNGKLGKGVLVLSDNQFDSLVEKMPIDIFHYYVEKLADFIINKNAVVKDHYGTILKWYEEDYGKKGDL